jgi:hypothetical protein
VLFVVGLNVIDQILEQRPHTILILQLTLLHRIARVPIPPRLTLARIPVLTPRPLLIFDGLRSLLQSVVHLVSILCPDLSSHSFCVLPGDSLHQSGSSTGLPATSGPPDPSHPHYSYMSSTSRLTPSLMVDSDTTSLINNQIREPPTVHSYILNSRGRDNSFIIVKSHALNAQDTPLLYHGEDIPGYVTLSHSDSSDTKRMDIVVSQFPNWYDCN